MEKISITQLGNAVKHLNSLIPGELYATVEGRNGGYGLDLCYQAEGTERTARTLVFGTKREVYDFVRAMREALMLVKEAS